MTIPSELQGRATVTIPEAGKLLGLNRNSSYSAAKAGHIPTLRVGERRLVVPVAPLLRMLGLEDNAATERAEAPAA